MGNLTSITATVAASSTLSGTTAFGYDSKDQLTSEVNGSTGAGYSNTFAYDSAGNATTFRGASRSFNSSNQFTGTGFVYDANGNPTTYAGSACTFDVFNRATSLGTALMAGYRSDGIRAWKQDSAGNRTYYLYDGDAPVQEMDASGNYKAEFVYGPAGLISHNRAGLGTVFFAYDALGSVQSVYTGTGSLISSRNYDAYGTQTGGIVADATHDDPEIGYNGQSGYITDPETGLVLCGHRYYDPAAGRWLNRDPIGYAGGIGLYNYCGNNPVLGVDVTGFQEVPDDPYNRDPDDDGPCPDEPPAEPIPGLFPLLRAIGDKAGQLYRSMREQNGEPEPGNTPRGLGARPGPGNNTDIPVEPDGTVRPGTGGMSVAPNTPFNLPPFRRPPDWGGTGKDPVWGIDPNQIPTSLVYVPDEGPDPTHGTIQPAFPMPFEQFTSLLRGTGGSWAKIDP